MKIYTLFIILVLENCQGVTQKDSVELEYPQSKLEQFLKQPQDSIYDYVDLSNDFLLELPDLSDYTIRSLDLSHNYITDLECYACKRPLELEKLDLSFNWIVTDIDRLDPNWLYLNISNLVDLDLSHNFIRGVVVTWWDDWVLRRLNLSSNRIRKVRFIHQRRMDYLNLSRNPDLYNNLELNSNLIDTLLR